MPAPNVMPPAETSFWVILITGGGLGTLLTAAYNFWSKLKDRADAKKKIAAEADIAKEKVAADAVVAHEKIEADALAAKEARVEDGVWKLIKETRDHADKMRADSRAEIEAMSKTMSLRIDTLTEEVAAQKERAGMAEVLTSVANLRADDADAERRELKAKLSVAMLQIESLQKELEARDSMDHQRQKELLGMRKKLETAQEQLNNLSTRPDFIPDP